MCGPKIEKLCGPLQYITVSVLYSGKYKTKTAAKYVITFFRVKSQFAETAVVVMPHGAASVIYIGKLVKFSISCFSKTIVIFYTEILTRANQFFGSQFQYRT